MAVIHFVIVIKHVWKKDWHQYSHEGILIQITLPICFPSTSSMQMWRVFLIQYAQSSGRELLYGTSGLSLLSTADQGKRSGLHSHFEQTIEFAVFLNEQRERRRLVYESQGNANVFAEAT